jgi:hypothetical protein
VAEPVLVFVLAVAMAVVVVVVVVVVPVMVPVVVLAGSCGGLAVMLPGRGRVWGRGEGCDLVARGSPCRVPVSQSAAGMRQRDNTLIPTIAACASATPAAATHTNRSYAQHTRSCPQLTLTLTLTLTRALTVAVAVMGTPDPPPLPSSNAKISDKKLRHPNTSKCASCNFSSLSRLASSAALPLTRCCRRRRRRCCCRHAAQEE